VISFVGIVRYLLFDDGVKFGGQIEIALSSFVGSVQFVEGHSLNIVINNFNMIPNEDGNITFDEGCEEGGGHFLFLLFEIDFDGLDAGVIIE